MRIGRHMLAALMALLIGGFCGAACAPLFAVPGFAEVADLPALEVEVSASPEALAEPGEVTLNFALVNRSDGTLEDLRLVAPDGTQLESLGALAPGESISFAHAHAVVQEELDAGAIGYALTCEADGRACSFPVEAAIRSETAAPQIEFLRQASNRYASDSGRVTIVYRIRNAGAAAVNGLSLSDPMGGFEANLEVLSAGETWTLINRAAVAEDAVSEPVLRYAVGSNSENVYTSRLDGLAFSTAQGRLDAALTAGRSLFDPGTAEVILRLSNAGGVGYRNIAVYDDIYGGIIADSIQLPVGGEAVEVAHSYPLRGDGSYRWRIIGENAAGDHIDFITETAFVRDETGDDVLLTLSAEASMTRINRRGYVPVTLELTNIGSALAANVLIHEETLGEIRQLTVVPTGDPTRIQVRVKVSESGSFTFYATYVDLHGQQRTAAAEPVEITIGAGGAAPEQEDPEQSLFGGLSMQMGNSSLFMGLLIGSIAVLITLIVVLLVTSRRARRRRKERTAARKQRIREELGKTNRFKPVKRNSKK